MRQRKILVALFALLLVLLAACKGESPTTPTTTPPITGTTGTTTPPTAASVNLTVSNANPLVGSQVTVTATVTQNGNPVPNGTAVQFTSTAGTFTDTGATVNNGIPGVLKTTTNGVASATLTSASASAVTVTATVNNVSKSTTVTFSATPINPPPPNTSPTISSITPSSGPPTGGETVTITGQNFRAPVRVVFTCEGTPGAAGTPPDPAGCLGQSPKDALVTSVTPTQITAVAPSFNVPSGKALSFSITVFVGAGTTSEVSVPQAAAIIYTSLTLTPTIRSLSPTSGSVDGGTRVTIFGDSFQAPVQVFFGAAEAQVISVNFNQIIVMSPKASDTAPTGSGTVVGPVDVRVRNVNTGASADATLTGGFRYVAKMQITTVGPTAGPISGGTKVTIDGTGFDDPLAVSIAGIAAQVIRVSATEVVAMTSQPANVTCAGLSGPVVVTNTNNGDSASSIAIFTYLVPQVHVVAVATPAPLGGTTTVTVLNASGVPRITIGGIPAPITSSTSNPDGTTTFTVQVPSSLTLTTQACAAVPGASAQAPTPFDVTYLSLTTGCTDTFPKGLIVNPSSPVLTLVPATGFAPFSAVAASGTTAATPAPDQTVTFTNTGAGTITVNSVTSTCVAPFTITPTPTPSTLNACDSFTVTAHYNTGPSGQAASCQVTINTTAGSRTLTLTGSTQ